MRVWIAVALLVGAAAVGAADGAPRKRARDLGIVIGELPPGPRNAITDVPGVRVGHASLFLGDSVRTGVTVVLPHGGDLFREKVPAAVHVGNAFGKLVGSTQVRELGSLESPIALTGTLNVWKVADALAAHLLALPGNQDVKSVNVVVGETNDGRLNDIRGRHVGREQVEAALAAAAAGPVEEGSVGAGVGTVCFGWKGGIGTASRVQGGWTVGVLVQTNFGGSLTVAGRRVAGGPASGGPGERRPAVGTPRGGVPEREIEDGSCMIVVATDAPLEGRNLERLARRALAGMARTGAWFSNGSGDYVIAFSSAPELRIRHDGGPMTGGAVLSHDAVSPLFRAVAEATEEAILNSLFRATTVASRFGRAEAIPLEEVLRAAGAGRKAGAREPPE